MAAQLIRDCVVMECLEGVWETLEGNERCQFRGTVRLTATLLVHPEQPARTLQQPVEWILPTPTPYRLVEPVQLIEVSSSEEDPEGDPEESSPEPAMDAADLPEDDEDPLPDVDSPDTVLERRFFEPNDDRNGCQLNLKEIMRKLYRIIMILCQHLRLTLQRRVVREGWRITTTLHHNGRFLRLSVYTFVGGYI
ncbi:hypothetical protein HKD37_02G004638 [Glycine soja]